MASACSRFSIRKKLWYLVSGQIHLDPNVHNCAEKLCLLVALAPLRGIHCVFRRLDIRTDVVHREALVLFTGALRTLPQVLLRLIERHLPAAVDADILAWTDFLSGFCFLGQFDHQTQIWMCELFMTFDSCIQTVQNVEIRLK